MALRRAVEEDLDALVALSSEVRDRLEALEPVFWRRHPKANVNQRAWFSILLTDDAHHVVVSTGRGGEVDGFAIARVMDAPPVFDPGGRTCMVDDLVWPTPEVAEALLGEVRRWAATKGCSQLVVVCPAGDDPRRSLLSRGGLHPTSEWWTGPV